MKIAPQWLGIVALALLFVVGMPSDSAPDPPKSLEEVARRLRVGMSIEVVCSLARAAGGRVGGLSYSLYSSQTSFRNEQREESLRLYFAASEGSFDQKLVKWELSHY